MDKIVKPAVMRKSRFKNKANRARNLSNVTNYKKQLNHLIDLNKKTKTENFINFDSEKVMNKSIWVIYNPHFLLCSMETKKIFFENYKIANILNVVCQ